MNRWNPYVAAVAAILVGACEGRIGSEEADNRSAEAEVSAEGKAEEGKISVKAPGFDLKFTLPKGMVGEARAERDSKLLYPGAILRGMAIAAGEGRGRGGDSEVEIGFSTADPLDRVIGWYRDPARADGFRLDRADREGEGWRVTGVQKRDGHRFKLRLAPRPGGGTDGRLTVRHRD
ncbi:MAG TPA: hypothetical protein VEA60_08430 [Allosphingosinicella sp.]|nr:hypothetical protein [Allosphingosinicella sp.]